MLRPEGLLVEAQQHGPGRILDQRVDGSLYGQSPSLLGVGHDLGLEVTGLPPVPRPDHEGPECVHGNLVEPGGAEWKHQIVLGEERHPGGPVRRTEELCPHLASSDRQIAVRGGAQVVDPLPAEVAGQAGPCEPVLACQDDLVGLYHVSLLIQPGLTYSTDGQEPRGSPGKGVEAESFASRSTQVDLGEAGTPVG